MDMVHRQGATDVLVRSRIVNDGPVVSHACTPMSRGMPVMEVRGPGMLVIETSGRDLTPAVLFLYGPPVLALYLKPIADCLRGAAGRGGMQVQVIDPAGFQNIAHPVEAGQRVGPVRIPA